MTPRQVLERVLRGRVMKRSLPQAFGHIPLFISAEAGLRYLFRPMDSIDPSLLDLAMEHVREGSRVWDIGANIGLFAFAAAQRAGATGQVVAVEPDVVFAELLQRSGSIQEASVAPVDVLPVAVAESFGVRNFTIAQRARATNHLAGYGSTQTGGTRTRRNVITLTLDQIRQLYPAPDVLKIDVEGAELEVLHGGSQFFSETLPVIICEVTNLETKADVGETLRAWGYTLYDADVPGDQRSPLALPAYNTLALPQSQAHDEVLS